MKTKLELLLDTVQAKQRELTIDCDGYTLDQVHRVKEAAAERGFHAAFDGRWILIRDLR